MTPSLKLTYFDASGRAEPVRLAFAIGGIPFEDFRFKRDQWPAVKAKTPYGSVPVLEVDGEMLTQSNAILRYAGKLSGLYPEDPLDAFRVDEVLNTMDDVIAAATSYMGPDKEKLREARQKMCTEAIPRYIGALEKRVKDSGNTPFFLGEQITIADLKILQSFSLMQSGFLDFVDKTVLDEYETLKAISHAVSDVPAVKQWYADHT